MELHLRLACILLAKCVLLASAAESNSSCSYCCTRGERLCGGSCGGWYTTTRSDGHSLCADRTSVEPEFYTFDFMCKLDPIRIIRDEISCQNVIKDKFSSPLADDYLTGKVSYAFDDEEGCRLVWLNANEKTQLKITDLETPVCFGMLRWAWILGTQLCAAVCAILAGVAGGCISNSPSADFLVEANQSESYMNWETFGPGSKLVAKNTLLGWKHENFLLFYRFTQVVACIWLPAVNLWTMSPIIAGPVFLLLFWLPTFVAVGVRAFYQPRHLVTPPLISLLGIDPHGYQEFAACRYLYSIIRTPLLLLTIWLAQDVMLRAFHAADIPQNKFGFAIVNSSAWPYLVSAPYWGFICIEWTTFTALAGWVLYTILTIRPLLKAACDLNPGKEYIKLTEDPAFQAHFDEMARRICKEATADDKEDKDRVEKLRLRTSHGEVHLSFWRRRDVVFAVAMALIDFVSYLVRIWTLLRESRCFLGMMMTFACVEAVTTLVYHGHLQRAWEACVVTARTGIPTVNFLALCQWDDGMAGIPALAITVYFLPLTFSADSTFKSVSVRFFFMITGTRALARYLCDVVDTGMYVMPDQKDMRYAIEKDFVNWGKNIAKQQHRSVTQVTQATRDLSDLVTNQLSKASRGLVAPSSRRGAGREDTQSYAALPTAEEQPAAFGQPKSTSLQLPNGNGAPSFNQHWPSNGSSSPRYGNDLLLGPVVLKESTADTIISNTSRQSEKPLLASARLYDRQPHLISRSRSQSPPMSPTTSAPTGGWRTPPSGNMPFATGVIRLPSGSPQPAFISGSSSATPSYAPLVSGSSSVTQTSYIISTPSASPHVQPGGPLRSPTLTSRSPPPSTRTTLRDTNHDGHANFNFTGDDRNRGGIPDVLQKRTRSREPMNVVHSPPPSLRATLSPPQSLRGTVSPPQSIRVSASPQQGFRASASPPPASHSPPRTQSPSHLFS